MSLSASDNTGSFSGIPSGKIPPLAPSAAFHKRSVLLLSILYINAEPTFDDDAARGRWRLRNGRLALGIDLLPLKGRWEQAPRVIP